MDVERFFADTLRVLCFLSEDPFPDPEDGIEEPESPVLPPDDPSIIPRIGEDESLVEDLTPDEIEARDRAAAAKASALTLEMIGDLPFASVRPPENILFVCKLNPVTQDEDLELIFSRFGKILSCEVIRDKKTGDSLQYAFIEFDEREAAEQVRGEAPYLLNSATLSVDQRLTTLTAPAHPRFRPTSRCKTCSSTIAGYGSISRRVLARSMGCISRTR